jgi:hypothetical protein
MRIEHHRSGWPITVGGACLLAGIFLLVLLLAGCAVGFGEPGPDGNAPVVYGLDLGSAASATNDFFGAVFEGIGGWLGVGGLGTGGVLISGLIRAWSNRRAQAAAAEAQRLGERAGWDEAAADHAARTTARDAAFDEGVARAAGGVGVARPSPAGPVVGEGQA